MSSIKPSGIIRKIDELGRLVIPKEMRYTLNIKEGEPLDIYTQDNMIIIKKYSQVESIKDIGIKLCDLMKDVTNKDIFISDREKVVATTNTIKSIMGNSLLDIHKNIIRKRLIYKSEVAEEMFGLDGYFVIVPIITSLDCSGLVFIVSKTYEEINLNYAKIIQKLIVNKIDGS